MKMLIIMSPSSQKVRLVINNIEVYENSIKTPKRESNVIKDVSNYFKPINCTHRNNESLGLIITAFSALY